MGQKGPGQAFIGVMIIIVGLTFLLSNMGYFEARNIFRNFWPMILIMFGVGALLDGRRNCSGHSGAFFWLGLGAIFLLSNLGILPIRLFWPLLPIGIGVLIMWRSFGGEAGGVVVSHAAPDEPANPSPDSSETSDHASPDQTSPNGTSTFSAFAILSGVVRRNSSDHFRSADITAIMGGCEIDLRGAAPAGGRAIIDVFALMGGIEIRVPADWTVVSEVTPILGGFDDETEAPKDGSKKLIVRGYAVMGGIDITN